MEHHEEETGVACSARYSVPSAFLLRWELEVLRTNPLCKKAHFYPRGEYHHRCTWFLKGNQTLFHFFMPQLNSEIGVVEIQVHVRQETIAVD